MLIYTKKEKQKLDIKCLSSSLLTLIFLYRSNRRRQKFVKVDSLVTKERQFERKWSYERR